MANIKQEIKDTMEEAYADGPSSTTYIVRLDYADGKTWAVVFGWVDDRFEDGEHLCGKIAYLPKNSGMSEYDMDWIMPYDEETGEVWDTEISDPDDFDIDWWLKEWEVIKKEFVYKDDIESATNIQSSKMYELTPNDGRKSFYGKAKVLIDDDGSETLYSYGTPIIRRNKNGDLDPLWDGYSATTGRHIASFAGLNKKQYMDLLEKKQGVESAEKIECVGHNDPGRYFDLIDYFDVWGNEDDGWEVNNQAVVEEDIWISDDTTEKELLDFLAGFYLDPKAVDRCEVEWTDPDFIEIFERDTYMPICRLQRSYKK